MYPQEIKFCRGQFSRRKSFARPSPKSLASRNEFLDVEILKPRPVLWFRAAVPSPAARMGTNSQAATDLVDESACNGLLTILKMTTATTNNTAIGSSELWAATETMKIAARAILRRGLNCSANASKNADKNSAPANTSGMSSDTSHGRLVSPARTETLASK